MVSNSRSRFRSNVRLLPEDAFRFPSDLRDWLPGDRLLQIVLGVVAESHCLAEPTARPSGDNRQDFSSKFLMSILLYAYATGATGSREIEILIARDPTLKYLCRTGIPDWNILRRFRRHSANGVESCLEVMLRRLWEMRPRPPIVEQWSGCQRLPTTRCRWDENIPTDHFNREALRRLHDAIKADSAALDD